MGTMTIKQFEEGASSWVDRLRSLTCIKCGEPMAYTEEELSEMGVGVEGVDQLDEVRVSCGHLMRRRTIGKRAKIAASPVQ